METISAYLTLDHRACDQLFAEAENAVAEQDWTAGAKEFGKFHAAMRHHFAMEEEVLFPAFEASTGNAFGPTRAMRAEHAEMRDLLVRMDKSVAERDRDAYLGLSETLLAYMQQHNVKEEQILYLMSDQALGAESARLIDAMKNVG